MDSRHLEDIEVSSCRERSEFGVIQAGPTVLGLENVERQNLLVGFFTYSNPKNKPPNQQPSNQGH
jgi:hypothetical protein